jgi:hypothetical protein
MDEKECIQFLKEFRDTIDKYLFLGYSPANNPFAKDYKQMHEINRSEFFIIDISQTDNDIWFYAGYIQGAGKLPIFIAKNGTLVKSSFVGLEYPVIYFEDEYDLWRKMGERINILRKEKEK